MPRLANLVALLAALTPALATLSNGQYTETIGAQELGSTTIDGTIVYSMNHCSIVHSTQCYTSLSTGGPAAPSSSSSSASASPPATPAPTYGQTGGGSSSGASVPVPTPTTVSSSKSVPGGEASTSTTEEGGSSSTTTKTPDVPTGAAVMGAPAVLGNVVVAALAALVV